METQIEREREKERGREREREGGGGEGWMPVSISALTILVQVIEEQIMRRVLGIFLTTTHPSICTFDFFAEKSIQSNPVKMAALLR